MSKRILFTHSYFMRFDAKQWALKQPYPPLATILAASVMRKQGYDVQLFDTMFSTSPMEINARFSSFKPDYLVIYDDGFNYLTKMCLTNMRQAAWQMQAIAHDHGCKVIVSSSDSTDHFKEYLNHGADFIILGEGENSLTDIIHAIDSGDTDITSIPGLAFLQDSEVVKTPKRLLMKDLDGLPMPAWDLVDVDTYRKVWLSRWGYFSLNVATTRGCPYKCNWCAKPIYGSAYNMRSPQHVVAELKYLQENYACNHIWFCDDIFGLRRNWVIEFAELVRKENLEIRYKIQSRADLLVQDKYVEVLANSGCYQVWMGAESGAQKVLDAMDKGTTTSQIREANHKLKQYGIESAFFLQFGYLGETMNDIQKTIEMLNECLPEDMGVSVSYPLPGTGFYDTVKADLKNKANWTDSDDLTLMFKNTYAPEFYKQLHKYVHKNYRKHQAIDAVWNFFSSYPSKKMIKRAASVFYYYPVAEIEKQKLKRIEPAASIL